MKVAGISGAVVIFEINADSAKAAERCRQVWGAMGRNVVPLVPKQAGWDFNDVVLERRV
jgi:hypothetical protein